MEYKNLAFKVDPSFNNDRYNNQRMHRRINDVLNGDAFAYSGIRFSVHLDETHKNIEELRFKHVQTYEFTMPIMRFLIARVNEILETSKIEPIIQETANL